MAAWAVSPERNSSTSFGSTGMMMPKDSMSSRTVMRMNSTAARRGVGAVGRSFIADASYQAHTSACRDKTIATSRRDLRLSDMLRQIPTDQDGDIPPFAGRAGQELRNDHTHYIYIPLRSLLALSQFSCRLFRMPVQQGRSRASTGGGTHRTSWGRSPIQWILANGKTPPVLPTSEGLLFNVEDCDEPRTKLGTFLSSLLVGDDSGC